MHGRVHVMRWRVNDAHITPHKHGRLCVYVFINMRVRGLCVYVRMRVCVCVCACVYVCSCGKMGRQKNAYDDDCFYCCKK